MSLYNQFLLAPVVRNGTDNRDAELQKKSYTYNVWIGIL